MRSRSALEMQADDEATVPARIVGLYRSATSEGNVAEMAEMVEATSVLFWTRSPNFRMPPHTPGFSRNRLPSTAVASASSANVPRSKSASADDDMCAMSFHAPAVGASSGCSCIRCCSRILPIFRRFHDGSPWRTSATLRTCPPKTSGALMTSEHLSRGSVAAAHISAEGCPGRSVRAVAGGTTSISLIYIIMA